MFIKQADLFWGMDHDFVNELIQVSEKETHKPGTVLFYEGEPARRFYILLKGRVRIDIGDDQQFFYIVSHGGEAFGWSGLLDMERYVSTGTCLDQTILLKFDTSDIQRLAEDNPVNGMMFYKKLSFILGNLLQNSYHMDYLRLHDPMRESFGTGQMVASEAL